MSSNIACINAAGCPEQPASTPTDGQILLMQGGQIVWADPDGSNAQVACTMLACVNGSGAITPGVLGGEGQRLILTGDGAMWAGGGLPRVSACFEPVTISDTGCVQRILCNGNETVTFDGATGEVICAEVPLVTALFTAAPLLACDEGFVALTDASVVEFCSGAPTYLYEFRTDPIIPFALFSTQQNPASNYLTNGNNTYYFRLTVTCGGVSDVSPIVTVQWTNLDASITADTNAIALGGSANVTDTSIAENCTTGLIYTHLFSLDGGPLQAYANTPNAVFTPVAAGTYQLTLQIDCDGHDFCSDTSDPVEVIVT